MLSVSEEIVAVSVVVLEAGSSVLTTFVNIETTPLEAAPESSYPDVLSGDR